MENNNKLKFKKLLNEKTNKLRNLRKKYNDLSQIDMLSSEGNKLDKQINVLTGEIQMLEYVLDKI